MQAAHTGEPARLLNLNIRVGSGSSHPVNWGGKMTLHSLQYYVQAWDLYLLLVTRLSCMQVDQTVLGLR